MPRLLLTKRCTLIWSIKPTLVGHSVCDAQLSHTPAALSLQCQVTKTAKKLCCDPETLQSPLPIASESLCWIKKSPALCASSLSTNIHGRRCYCSTQLASQSG